MRKIVYSVALIAMIALVMQGCVGVHSAFSSPQLHSNDHNDTTMLLFSDPENLPYEGPYYDAILALQTEEGHDETELIVCDSTERHVVNHYSIDEFPTMLVYKGDEEMLRVSGQLDLSNIYTQLETAIQ